MPVSTEVASALVDQVFLLQRAVRSATASREPGELPLSSLGILGMLQRRPDLRFSDLAACVGVSASVMSRQIADLIEADLVVKVPDADDGRAWRVRLTDHGATALDTARAVRSARICTLLADWTDAETEEVTAAVAKLAALLGPPDARPAASAANMQPNSEKKADRHS